jgi:hypothetical protein
VFCGSLSVPLVIVLSIIVCPFDHCIVYHCLSLWSLYCLSLSVPLTMTKGTDNDRQYNDQRDRQW